MNYQRIHDQIIERAKLEDRKKSSDVYYERHHIIPRCLDGTDDAENLVLLTAREHFIVHLLLAKIHNHHKLWWAAKMLSSFGRSSSRTYQTIVENLKHSEETKRKISKSQPNKKGKNHPMYGKTHSEETKRKMKLTRQNLEIYPSGWTLSEETKHKMKRPKSEQHKNNMKGRKNWSTTFIEITTNTIGSSFELSEIFNIPASSIHWNAKHSRPMRNKLNFKISFG